MPDLLHKNGDFMMKKNYFIRSFNIALTFKLASMFLIILGWAVKYFMSITATDHAVIFHKLIITINYFASVFILVGFLLIITVFLLVSLELVSRLLNDKVWNYFKSVYRTLSLRNFLYQSEHKEKIVTIEGQPITTYNPVNVTFNRAARKCVVDIKKDTVTVFLKVPKTQQAQKLLNEMIEQIKEEISNRNPDYFFSSEQRIGTNIWFEGKRR